MIRWKGKDQKEIVILWCQGSFALLHCFRYFLTKHFPMREVLRPVRWLVACIDWWRRLVPYMDQCVVWYGPVYGPVMSSSLTTLMPHQTTALLYQTIIQYSTLCRMQIYGTTWSRVASFTCLWSLTPPTLTFLLTRVELTVAYTWLQRNEFIPPS